MSNVCAQIPITSMFPAFSASFRPTHFPYTERALQNDTSYHQYGPASPENHRRLLGFTSRGYMRGKRLDASDLYCRANCFQELNCAIKLLKLAKRTLEDRLGAMRPLENRRVPQEHHIVNYLNKLPADSIMTTLERLERTFEPKRWPQVKSVEDLLSLRTQFHELERYNLPAQRVVIAALHLESRNNCISRIRNVFIADAIDTSVNHNGFARSSLQPALEQLADDLNEDDLKTLKHWRKSGEWLLDFFQHIPLGAICMMDKQTAIWGSSIGTGYVDPIARYCRALPNFITHATSLTPAACQAIHKWANIFTYPWKPGSSLCELVDRQEQACASSTAAELLFYPPISPGGPSEVSHYEMEEELEHDASNLSQLVSREVSGQSLQSNNVDACSVVALSPKTAGASLRGDEAHLSLDGRTNTSGMLYSPLPPRTLSVPENLFHAIKVYSIDSCQQMRFGENEVLLSLDNVEFRNDLCTEFDSYCFTATMLKERGSLEDFGRTMSKGFALVEPVLRANHPRTLACFFEVLIHLIQTGLPEVALALRSFIREMSANIKKDDLCSRIYQLLNGVDQASLVHVIAQGWRCATDVFDDSLGPSHRLAVSVRLDYVKRVMINNHLEEERLLRGLLSQFKCFPGHPTPRVMFNLAHNLNRQGRHDEAETIALEVSTMLQRHEIYAGRDSEKIESLKILSHCRFLQGKALEAEFTIREAINLIRDHWGQQHPWALEFMNVLENWLRCWGRDEDADVLHGGIATSLRPFG